jgi:hypothetical protein
MADEEDVIQVAGEQDRVPHCAHSTSTRAWEKLMGRQEWTILGPKS